MLSRPRIWSTAVIVVVAAVLSSCIGGTEQTHRAPVSPSTTHTAPLSEDDSIETVALAVASRLVESLRTQPAGSVHASKEFGAGLLTTYKEIGSDAEALSRPQLHISRNLDIVNGVDVGGGNELIIEATAPVGAGLVSRIIQQLAFTQYSPLAKGDLTAQLILSSLDAQAQQQLTVEYEYVGIERLPGRDRCGYGEVEQDQMGRWILRTPKEPPGPNTATPPQVRAMNHHVIRVLELIELAFRNGAEASVRVGQPSERGDPPFPSHDGRC